MRKDSPIDNHLRRLRFEHGEMSQETLARAVGITRQTVIALESLRYAPSLELAMKLADVFGVAVDEVFFWRTARTTPGTS
ncbi:helix-turn-helix transcriptional regulator [Massilia sp. CMS3.1]|uniref:helix-turn-helix transcriptional regulator n=1 Tax=Massilia sp. CMS3.1 TaxID=3373083 RepID=UPI003EE48570